MNVDNGRQAERTVMAWQRTALGLGGVSALLIHDAQGDLLASVTGSAGLVAALAVLVVADAHHRRHHDADPEHTPTRIAMVRVMTGLTVLLSLTAALALLFSAG